MRGCRGIPDVRAQGILYVGNTEYEGAQDIGANVAGTVRFELIASVSTFDVTVSLPW